MNTTIPTRRKNPRSLQFSLRTMLLLVAVMAVWLGIQVNRATRQKAAVESVLELGGTVYYEHQISTDSMGRHIIDPRLEMPNPRWLRSAYDGHLLMTASSVTLRDTDVTDADVERILAGIPYVRTLDLANTQITDRAMRQIAELTNLRALELTGTQVTDDGLAFLSGLQKLDTLSLWKMGVGDDGVKHLSGLTNLRNLVLDETGVTDAGLVHLAGLTNLEEWLGLTHNQISDQGIEHLYRMKKLRHLNLIGTQVSRDGLRRLREELPQADVSPY